MVKGSLINQRANDQSEYPDTNNPVMEGLMQGLLNLGRVAITTLHYLGFWR